MAYFSNGTEGEILDEQCMDCPLGAGWNNLNQAKLFDLEPTMRPCPVASVQFSYNYKQSPSGRGARATADVLEGMKPPTFVEGKTNGNMTVSYGSSASQLKTAIEWLRSTDFADAMNILINEKGICQVREQLRQIRNGQDSSVHIMSNCPINEQTADGGLTTKGLPLDYSDGVETRPTIAPNTHPKVNYD